MASQKALEYAAQAWCAKSTENLVMIPELCEEFANIIDKFVPEFKELPDLKKDTCQINMTDERSH